MPISLTTLSRPCGANSGSIIKLYLALASDVNSIPNPANQVIQQDIIMKPGKTFVPIEFTVNSAGFAELLVGEMEGHSFEQRVEFIITRDRPAVVKALNRLTGARFIAIYQDANGYKKVLGTLECPMRLQQADLDTGAGHAERHHRKFALVGEGLNKSYFYTGQIPIQYTFGNALHFNGLNQYVNCGSNLAAQLNGATEFTFEFWLLPRAVANTGIIMGCIEPAQGISQGLQIAYSPLYSGDRLQLFADLGGNFYLVGYTGNTPLAMDSWQHNVITYSTADNLIRFYLNGIPDGQAAALAGGGPLAVGNFPWLLGIDNWSLNGGYPLFLPGALDDIRIYTRATTLQETEHSFNGGFGNNPLNSTGLLERWLCDEESGLILSASVSSNNNGQLVNMPGDSTNWKEHNEL